MLLALADTLHFGFMQRIDFAGVTALLRKYTFKELDERVVVEVVLQVAPQFPDKSSGNGAKQLVRFQGIATVLGVVTEALVMVIVLLIGRYFLTISVPCHSLRYACGSVPVRLNCRDRKE